ncbi:PucR family transcriptional regulator [Nocardioides humilatus]|uniref:PucR family transcriptional regulator n=1 Tax=Nocardioides humilatus TaxID=2607660 RepID=A0A5B1LG83_9ACTN|nr:PucR family transcriptional regulator [Nocardioides humilatus]KAA1419354.1 PucR family transcriptional regulator [Nocardioides humilatus]
MTATLQPTARAARASMPPEIARVARTLTGPLTDLMTEVIQERVVPFRNRQRDDLLPVLREPIRAGITSYIDILETGPGRRADVEERFQEVGRQEALHGNGLENLRAIMLIAARSSWQVIHRRCRELQVPDGILGRLGDLLFAHIDNLERQITIGYLRTQSELRQDTARWRGPLLTALLSDTRTDDLDELAAATGWRLPSTVRVITVRTPSGFDLPDGSGIPDTALVQVDHPVTTVIAAESHAEGILGRVLATFAGLPVAISWAVPVRDAADGARWASRALDLHDRGVLGCQPVIECSEHVATLWLHAEPLLRERVVDHHLAPLMTEPPRSRQVLCETLLLYLETHGSAPALAAHLDVHPQTVRYRLRRLREMFGDVMDSPDALTLLLALRSSPGLWRG